MAKIKGIIIDATRYTGVTKIVIEIKGKPKIPVNANATIEVEKC